MILRKFRGAVAAAILATSLAGEGGAVAAAAAAPAPSFSLSGVLVAANANTHRISVRVGAMRHSIVLTPRTRYLVQRHEATLFALRARMRVTVRGLVQARWREAVVVTVGPGPVPGAVPAPANTALKGALGSALEREQYALASYQNVVSQLGPIGPFPNVIQGEQQHVATLKAFFAEYGISLPTTLVSGASAPATTTGACALGVSIEQSLISLYDQQLANVTSYADVQRAFLNFRTVSEEHHLPAFERCSSAGGGGAGGGGTGAITPASPALQTALGSALEREQYALASYQNVVSQLGPIGPFPNVIQGEQQHVATLKAFFAEYGISLPTTLVSGASAPATTTGACALGVSIEQSLISLYDQQLANVTSYADVTRAFLALRSASAENHLPAFEVCS